MGMKNSVRDHPFYNPAFDTQRDLKTGFYTIVFEFRLESGGTGRIILRVLWVEK
jgi:hypothetical protein